MRNVGRLFRCSHSSFNNVRSLFSTSSVNLQTPQRIPSRSSHVNLDKYHCVGFDLDHTLCQYNLTNLLPMIYSECLVPFLSGFLNQAINPVLGAWDEGRRLCARGLVFDSLYGNLLKISATGCVQLALHGSRVISSDDTRRVYSSDTALKNLLLTLCDPPCGRFRILRDFFDAPIALAAARMVDGVDDGRLPGVTYNDVGKSLSAALVHMYHRDRFSLDHGGFFHILRSNTDNYASRCSEKVVKGLIDMKCSGKILFLLTSSNLDYANHMASIALGNQWRQYFDLVITFARKPLFFRSRLPFLGVDEIGREGMPVNQLSHGQVYSQGNWQDLEVALAALCGQKYPLCLYVGDNVAFDILPVLNYTRAHCVALCEEMDHSNTSIRSSIWGGFLDHNEEKTVWGKLVGQSTICLSRVDELF